MNEFERYQFDLGGYLLVKGLLEKELVGPCLKAVTDMERNVAETVELEPLYTGHFGTRFHFDEELGYSSYKNVSGGGIQYIVDDFLNASPAFDPLVGHSPTMEYVRELIAGTPLIGSSELRYRHKSNRTNTHMGGVIDARNRYNFIGRPMMDCGAGQTGIRHFDLLGVRLIYALHDIPMEGGPLCVVPGSHKANFFSPYGEDPTKEPGMIGIPMEAGDALFFTENVRHGGLPNFLDTPRKTLHLFYGPDWAGSQSQAHWNSAVYVKPEVWARYSPEQRAVMPPPDSMARQEVRRLQNEVASLKEELRQYQNGSVMTRVRKALRV